MKGIYKKLSTVFLLIISFIGVNSVIYAQEYLGGTQIYGFLSQSPSARQTALGNAAISYAFPTSDVMFSNPALLDSKHNYSASVQHQFQFSDIASGTASYAQSFIDSTWTFGLGIQYLDYGDFQGYDEYEIRHGEFSAMDIAMQGTIAKQIGPRLHIGTNLKFINSTYESYKSTGIGVDIGAHYYIEESLLGFSFLMKNLVFQLSSYNENEKIAPVDFQIGMSKRLEHLPMRFQVTYHHLNKWKLLSDEKESGQGSLFDQGEKSALDILANDFLSHIVFSAELGAGKNQPVFLRLSYNHYIGQSLSVSYYRAFTGINMGVGLNIKGLKVDYGYSIAHLAGGRHHLGIAYTFGRKPEKSTLRR